MMPPKAKRSSYLKDSILYLRKHAIKKSVAISKVAIMTSLNQKINFYEEEIKEIEEEIFALWETVSTHPDLVRENKLLRQLKDKEGRVEELKTSLKETTKYYKSLSKEHYFDPQPRLLMLSYK